MSEETTTTNEETTPVEPPATETTPTPEGDYQFQNKGNDGWKMFKSAYNEDPSEFKDTYNDALKSKIMDKINDRRVEINGEINDALKSVQTEPVTSEPASVS